MIRESLDQNERKRYNAISVKSTVEEFDKSTFIQQIKITFAIFTKMLKSVEK